MKVIVLLFAMLIGSLFALKDALSGLTYQQESVNLMQYNEKPSQPLAKTVSVKAAATKIKA
ncbi:MAG: hypothetical protein ACO1OQ_03965 [Rufibacter sp.]